MQDYCCCMKETIFVASIHQCNRVLPIPSELGNDDHQDATMNLAMGQNKLFLKLKHPISMLNFLDLLYLNLFVLSSWEHCNQVHGIHWTKNRVCHLLCKQGKSGNRRICSHCKSGNRRICTLEKRKFGIWKLSNFSKILEKIFFFSN